MTNMSQPDRKSPLSLPSHPELDLRPFAERPDYQGLAQAINASFAADGIDNTVAPQELENFYRHLPDFDPARDLLLAWDEDQVVGEAFVVRFREARGQRIYFHHTYLRPEWRSDALMADLVGWAEARAGRIHSQLTAREARLRSVVRQGETAFKALLERRGYNIERYFYTMVRPIQADIPAAPLPEGLEVRPVKTEHLRAIWEAKEEAFADHWGKRETARSDYERWLEDPLQDPQLWKVAWDGDEVAGMVLNFIDENENRKLGRRRGYTENIAVRRPWRRQGLASHLIAESLRMLRRLGMQEAALGVDVENPSRALGLYQRFGYEVTRREDAYARPLPDSEPGGQARAAAGDEPASATICGPQSRVPR